MTILSQDNAAILQHCARQGLRCHIVLDLDNTLISAIPYHVITPQHRNLRLKSHAFGNDFIIFERPGVQRLLDYLFANYSVSVWSAGSRDYVNYVVQEVISRETSRPRPRVPFLVLNRDHCVASQQINPDSPKDLRFLWSNPHVPFEPETTLIIDDLPDVYRSQPSNTIAIPPFDLERQNIKDADTALSTLLGEMIHVTAAVPRSQK